MNNFLLAHVRPRSCMFKTHDEEIYKNPTRKLVICYIKPTIFSTEYSNFSSAQTCGLFWVGGWGGGGGRLVSLGPKTCSWPCILLYNVCITEQMTKAMATKSHDTEPQLHPCAAIHFFTKAAADSPAIMSQERATVFSRDLPSQ